jgi:transposase
VINLSCLLSRDIEEMITVKELGRIRRWYHRDGLTLSEIARKSGLARNTVKRWLREAESVEPKCRRRPGDTKIGPYAEQLLKMLEMDARRPKRGRRSALKLFAELKAQGFDGDYSRVTEFIRGWRDAGGQVVTRAYVPLKFELGEAFQFDWSEELTECRAAGRHVC